MKDVFPIPCFKKLCKRRNWLIAVFWIALRMFIKKRCNVPVDGIYVEQAGS